MSLIPALHIRRVFRIVALHPVQTGLLEPLEKGKQRLVLQSELIQVRGEGTAPGLPDKPNSLGRGNRSILE